MFLKLGGINFKVSRPLCGASAEKVWKRVRDVRSMPKYWRGHREVKVERDEGESVFIRIRFAFPGPLNKGLAKVSINDKRMELIIEYLKGPIKGRALVKVSNEEASCEYDVRLSVWLSPFSLWVRGHFMKGVDHALERILLESGAQNLTWDRGAPTCAPSLS